MIFDALMAPLPRVSSVGEHACYSYGYSLFCFVAFNREMAGQRIPIPKPDLKGYQCQYQYPGIPRYHCITNTDIRTKTQTL